MGNNGGPIKCPACGREMTRRRGRFGDFLGCSGYPTAGRSWRWTKTGTSSPPAPKLITTHVQCPQCGKPMQLAGDNRGLWLGCSEFPRCRGRLSFDQLPTADQEQLKKALEDSAKLVACQTRK